MNDGLNANPLDDEPDDPGTEDLPVDAGGSEGVPDEPEGEPSEVPDEGEDDDVPALLVMPDLGDDLV
jgi:hypothetical protein